MNIKCFSDLEKWMQGVVKQVQVATGTTDVMCLSIKVWGGDKDSERGNHSIWIAVRLS